MRTSNQPATLPTMFTQANEGSFTPNSGKRRPANDSSHGAIAARENEGGHVKPTRPQQDDQTAIPQADGQP
jgi:hypothetical protein